MRENRPTDPSLIGWEKEMAELDSRLRLLVAPSDPDRALWPVLARLEVQTALLVGVVQEEGRRSDLLAALRTLRRLLDTVQEKAAALPGVLEGLLEQTADLLEGLIGKLDGRMGLDAALEDPGWDLLRARYRDLETPFAVFNDIQEQLQRWQEDWCEEDLSPDQEKQLRDRWRRLRGLADVLFDPDPSAGSDSGGPSLLRWQGFDTRG